ncbi:MAG: glycosyltransferase, partial [Bacilli bacterium]
MKVLTILVPIYNVEKYLKRCLDSIMLNEILNDIEVILVNDGSKDSSLDIMKQYKEKFPSSIVIV